MSNTKMINAVNISVGAPTDPEIGDLYIVEEEDEFTFFVWDGDMWIGTGSRDMQGSSTEEEDTPEKAYDRAMGVVR